MLTREWFTVAELAALALPGMPSSRYGMQVFADRREWKKPEDEGRRWRTRSASGGGIEFHYTVLPSFAAAKLVVTFTEAAESSGRAAQKSELTRAEMHAWYERLPDGKKAKAAEKAAALDMVRDLQRAGMGKVAALGHVAGRLNIQKSTLYAWEDAVAGIDRCDWMPYLAPRHAGASESAECSPEAWAFIKADYLRLERPTLKDCYRRLERAAKEHGWSIPSERTLTRRINDLPEGLRVLAREGSDALKRMYPAQQRDRGVFHALEAVNADGHKWDVFVRWPDGHVGRPLMVAFQDLYSGKMLAWRVDRSENKEAVRLAFGDLVEEFGIPDHCWLDNGRSFASKWLTGGTPNRYRFKVRDDEPAGILTQIGVEVHWTTPYAGQSKPIERAFRDFASGTAKHPRFAGAYTGNSPMAKPENYASKAVPLDVFLATVAEEIAAHNARPGRATKVCGGRSFDQAFSDSYAQAPIRKATPEQRRLWLLAAEAISASKVDGSLSIEGNRFWAEFLSGFRGQKLTVRFDPQQLHQPLHVYRLDGAYLGAAPVIEAVGFADKAASQQHNHARNSWRKAHRQMLDAERDMTIQQVAALLPQAEEPPPPPETKVVRLVTRGSAALKPIPMTTEENDPQDAVMDALAQMNRARRGAGHLRAVESLEDAGD